MSTTIVTGIGRSEDSYTLGKTIAAEAKRKLGQETPDVVLVFVSRNQNYDRLMHGIREITGDIPMIGSSTDGEFTEERHSKDGVVCAFIKSDTHLFSIGMGNGLKHNVDTAVSQAITQLRVVKIPEYPHRTAMMFMDTTVGRSEETVSAASRVLGADIELAGGACTHIFYNGNAYADAVAFCLVHSKKRIRMAATHGHYPFGDVMTVTKAKDARIYEIDGKNAWEVWKEVSRERREELGFTDETLEDQACRGRCFPYFAPGFVIDGNRYKVRTILDKYPDGSFDFSCNIPEGTEFRMMYSDKSAQLTTVERATKLAKIYTSKKTAGAFIFDCVCRDIILEDDYYKSIQGFNNVLKGIPFIGFETYGEICTGSAQLRGFLHTACVVMIIPD